MITKVVVFFETIFFIICAFGCNCNLPNEDKQKVTQREDEKELYAWLLSSIDNKTVADTLIKTTYSEEKLRTMPNSLAEIIEEMPPECIRQAENEDIIYFVYKSESGTYAFWMYSMKSTTNTVLCKWYLGKPVFLKDFEEMANRNANLSEVMDYDPYGSYISFEMSSVDTPYSYHYTVDGYMIRIDYTVEIGTPLNIATITKYSGDDNPMYYNLLTIDKTLINKDDSNS